jgi:spore maturation protein CgeB
MKLSPSNESRILLVGEYMWPWYQEACAQALEFHGCKVDRFGWVEDFWKWIDGRSEPVYLSMWLRLQYRLRFGPKVRKVNERLITLAKKTNPNIIWFYNVDMISYTTVKKLREILPTATFCQFSNDNPFSSAARPGLWRQYLKSINYFDIHFVFRHCNIFDYKRFGSKNTQLLRSYFIPEVNYPVPQLEIPDRFICDVVFAGHYEDDGRLEMLESICNAGYNLNLFGGGWNSALPKLRADSPLRAKYPISPVVGVDYRYAICGAKVALCFLSALNNDTYTTRNFEIPAMKVAMLSQYTDDLVTMFVPDIEAVFFRNHEELLTKLQTLIAHDQQRADIAEAGYVRVYANGHDVKARMGAWLKYVNTFTKSSG